jgi:hypothetical protein
MSPPDKKKDRQSHAVNGLPGVERSTNDTCMYYTNGKRTLGRSWKPSEENRDALGA